MARTLPSYRSREEALFKGKAESVGHGNQACDFMKRQKRTTKGDRLTLSRLVKVKVRVSFKLIVQLDSLVCSAASTVAGVTGVDSEVECFQLFGTLLQN